MYTHTSEPRKHVEYGPKVDVFTCVLVDICKDPNPDAGHRNKTKQPKYMKIRAGKRNAETLEKGLEREQMQETESWPVKEGQHVYRMLNGDR